MKQALIVGGARSGIEAAKYLVENQYQVTLTDINSIENKEELEKLGILVVDQGHPISLLETKYNLVVKNPGIPNQAPFIQELIKSGYDIINEVELASRLEKNFSYAAITGTNGKTTTTMMLYHMLSQGRKPSYLAGNIGVPLTKVAREHHQAAANIALELSSFQLMNMPSFRPKVAAIINLEPDHLDFHKDLDEYYQIKQNIYKNQISEDYFLLNLDDENVNNFLKKNEIKSRIITYSLKTKADVMRLDDTIYFKEVPLFSLTDLKVPGEHNLYNAMVAATMSYLMGVEPEGIKKSLASFTGVEHRLEYVGCLNDISFYNDSKATNVEATIVALNSFTSPVHLLIGGHNKKIDYSLLAQHKDRVKKAYCFGEIKNEFHNIFSDVEIFDDLEEATLQAYQEASQGEVILLSPATSSFDQYDSFESRGAHFKNIFTELKAC